MSNQQTREFGIPSSAEPRPLEAVVLKIFARSMEMVLCCA